MVYHTYAIAYIHTINSLISRIKCMKELKTLESIMTPKFKTEE